MSAGGDALLMACLWKAGYAISDPGFSFYHPELRMFDPVSQEGRQLLYAFTEGLSGGCDDSCQVRCCFPTLLLLLHLLRLCCLCLQVLLQTIGQMVKIGPTPLKSMMMMMITT